MCTINGTGCNPTPRRRKPRKPYIPRRFREGTMSATKKFGYIKKNRIRRRRK